MPGTVLSAKGTGTLIEAVEDFTALVEPTINKSGTLEWVTAAISRQSESQLSPGVEGTCTKNCRRREFLVRSGEDKEESGI